jgi:hypothetical protein
MKNMWAVVAAGAICAAGAMAQEHEVVFDKMVPQVRVMGLQGSIMGRTVKNAPYSGVEIAESTQMLADGTRIHNETQTQVYRDSEGRMRRETPNEITIWDPVANASWVLNPKGQTARKLPMGTFFYSTSNAAGGGVVTNVMRAGPPEMGRITMTDDVKGAKAAQEIKITHVESVRTAEAKLKQDVEQQLRVNATAGVMVAGPTADIMTRKSLAAQKLNHESLGKRMMEGVNVEGTRMTATTDAGAIGNDRPINTVTERWFSPDLQTVMLTRTTDPRSGEEVFKLVNVNRSEPAAYLFQVPAGYQVIEGGR